jgi:peptidoglycan/xylan/chitin deacetylase (PgdA/CDA1 family)
MNVQTRHITKSANFQISKLLPCIMRYFIKTPWLLRQLYPSRVWRIHTTEKIIYLTFDDGPHPEATGFVLDELKKFEAKATFFCIGKNVEAHPGIYNRILREGHAVGNHTQQHLNGWKTDNESYIKDVEDAASKIRSGLFRPPYGRLRSSQARRIPTALQHEYAKIIMWDVLSGDFDKEISGEQCFRNATGRSTGGSVIVFHDSEKALPRLQYALPRTLKFFAEKGYRFFHL